MEKRYITDDTKYSMVYGGDDEGVPNSLRTLALDAAKAGNTALLCCIILAVTMALRNETILFARKRRRAHFPRQTDKSSLSRQLGKLQHSVLQATEAFQHIQLLEGAYRSGQLSNRSVCMLEGISSCLEADGKPVRFVALNVPPLIARSFHPDLREPLPDYFITWVSGKAGDDSRAGLAHLRPVNGYDLVRINGLWQSSYETLPKSPKPMSKDHGTLRINLDSLAHDLYDRGLDIGAPDDELRRLLDPFIANPT